jgi:hypothetical protein
MHSRTEEQSVNKDGQKPRNLACFIGQKADIITTKIELGWNR